MRRVHSIHRLFSVFMVVMGSAQLYSLGGAPFMNRTRRVPTAQKPLMQQPILAQCATRQEAKEMIESALQHHAWKNHNPYHKVAWGTLLLTIGAHMALHPRSTPYFSKGLSQMLGIGISAGAGCQLYRAAVNPHWQNTYINTTAPHTNALIMKPSRSWLGLQQRPRAAHYIPRLINQRHCGMHMLLHSIALCTVLASTLLIAQHSKLQQL